MQVSRLVINVDRSVLQPPSTPSLVEILRTHSGRDNIPDLPSFELEVFRWLSDGAELSKMLREAPKLESHLFRDFKLVVSENDIFDVYTFYLECVITDEIFKTFYEPARTLLDKYCEHPPLLARPMTIRLITLEDEEKTRSMKRELESYIKIRNTMWTRWLEVSGY